MKRRLGGLLPAAALMIAVTGVGLGLVVVGSGAAQGQNQPPPPGGGMQSLPAAAIEACEGLAAQDACPITTPDGDAVTGQCTPTPDEKLACLPEGPPPRT